jgi:hypothetical protein
MLNIIGHGCCRSTLHATSRAVLENPACERGKKKNAAPGIPWGGVGQSGNIDRELGEITAKRFH